MILLFIFHHIDFMHNDNIIECAFEYCLSMYTVNILYMIIIIFYYHYYYDVNCEIYIYWMNVML